MTLVVGKKGFLGLEVLKAFQNRVYEGAIDTELEYFRGGEKDVEIFI